MYEYVISCATCAGQRSTHGLEEQANFTDEEVLALAGHSPDCSIKRSGQGIVTRSQRDGEPNLTLYSITEVQ